MSFYLAKRHHFFMLAMGLLIALVLPGMAQDQPLPAPAVSSAQAVDNTSARFVYEAVPGADGYALFVLEGSEDTPRLLQESKELAMVYSQEAAGRALRFVLAAYQTAGDGQHRYGALSQVYPIYLRDALFIRGLRQTQEGVQISYSKSGSATGYLIERAKEGGDFQQIALLEGQESLEYLDKDAEAGNVYLYRVAPLRKVDGLNGIGAISKEYRVEIILHNHLPAPVITSLLPLDNNTASLQFEPVSGASAYALFRYAPVLGTYEWLQEIKDTKIVLTEPSPGLVHSYALAAQATQDGVLSYGSFSPPFAVFMRNAPAITSIRQISASKVEITWKEDPRAEAYRLVRLDAQDGIEIQVGRGRETSMVDQIPETAPGTNLAYRLSSYVSSPLDQSPLDGALSKTSLLYVPGQARLRSIAWQEQNMLALSWHSVYGANAYVLYTADAEHGSYTRQKTSLIPYASLNMDELGWPGFIKIAVVIGYGNEQIEVTISEAFAVPAR